MGGKASIAALQPLDCPMAYATDSFFIAHSSVALLYFSLPRPMMAYEQYLQGQPFPFAVLRVKRLFCRFTTR
jgi:hypothetical protein